MKTMTEYAVMMAKQGTGTREFVNIGDYKANNAEKAIEKASKTPDGKAAAKYMAVPKSYVTLHNPINNS
jgi:hypothetical protein